MNEAVKKQLMELRAKLRRELPMLIDDEKRKREIHDEASRSVDVAHRDLAAIEDHLRECGVDLGAEDFELRCREASRIRHGLL